MSLRVSNQHKRAGSAIFGLPDDGTLENQENVSPKPEKVAKKHLQTVRSPVREPRVERESPR